MSKAGEVKIAASTEDYTKVSFKPDLPKFGMDCLNRDMVALLTKRVYDLAGCLTGVKMYLNGKRVPVSEPLGLLSQQGTVCVSVCTHAFICTNMLFVNSCGCSVVEGCWMNCVTLSSVKDDNSELLRLLIPSGQQFQAVC